MITKVSLRRRISYAIATLLFVASSVVVTLFSFGYRFSFEHGIFIHSGTITLKTTPRRVSISLNGENINEKAYDLINNSYNINGLRPGKYTVEVSSPGYSSWKKTINVHSGLSTEFWNVVLTKNEPGSKRLDIVSPVSYKVSSSGKKIVYATKASGPMQIFLYLPQKESALKIYEEPANRMTTSSLGFMEFSPDENSLLFSLKEGDLSTHFLARLDKIESGANENSNVIPLNIPFFDFQEQIRAAATQGGTEKSETKNSERLGEFLKNPAKIRMSTESLAAAYLNNPNSRPQNPEIQQSEVVSALDTGAKTAGKDFGDFKWLDNDIFCFMHKGSLYSFNLNREEIRFVLKDARGYEISQGNIFFVKGPSNLVFKSDRTGAEIAQITENMIDQDIPAEAQNYKLTIYDETRMAIANQNGELYLFNNNPDEYQTFKKIGERNRGVQFSDDGKKLLYFNEDEIKVYYVREWDVQPKNNVGSNVEIYRNKEKKIIDAMWHKDYQHVVFALDGMIKIVEIDTRDQINLMDIVKSELANPQFTLDSRNEVLYFCNNSDKFVQLFNIELVPAKGIGDVFQ